MHILIQARSTSTRLPGKIFKELAPGVTVLDQCYQTCHSICATTILVPNNDLQAKEYCTAHKYPFLDGPLNNVLTRYMEAIDKLNCDYAVRITSDCPLIPVAQLFYMMAQVQQFKIDFCSNLPTVDGFDIDILSFRAWHWLHKNAKSDVDREHVTSYLRAPEHLKEFIKAGMSYMNYVDPVSVLPTIPKLSIDTEQDLAFVSAVHNNLLSRSKTILPGEEAHDQLERKSGDSPS
jgi:spore coat polysaccharide biosynthesis protein SpsF